jgi:Ankyrin repeats (3 copies)
MTISRLHDNVILDILSYLNCNDILSLYGASTNAMRSVLSILYESKLSHHRELYVELYKAKFGLAGSDVIDSLYNSRHESVQQKILSLYSREDIFRVASLRLHATGSEIDVFRKAVRSGHANIVTSLIKVGVSRDCITNNLSRGISRGDTEIVRILLRAGAQQNDDNLADAARKGHLEIVRILVEFGADIDGFAASMAVRVAVIEGHSHVVEFLVDNGARIIKPMMIDACCRRHASVVETLLRKGAYPDPENLLFASRVGFVDIAKLLISAGADMETNNWECLRTAARKGQTGIVALLLDNGGDVHVLNDEPLVNAVGEGHLDTVKYLLEHGADVNARDRYCVRLVCEEMSQKTRLDDSREYREIFRLLMGWK